MSTETSSLLERSRSSLTVEERAHEKFNEVVIDAVDRLCQQAAATKRPQQAQQLLTRAVEAALGGPGQANSNSNNCANELDPEVLLAASSARLQLGQLLWKKGDLLGAYLEFRRALTQTDGAWRKILAAGMQDAIAAQAAAAAAAAEALARPNSSRSSARSLGRTGSGRFGRATMSLTRSSSKLSLSATGGAGFRLPKVASRQSSRVDVDTMNSNNGGSTTTNAAINQQPASNPASPANSTTRKLGSRSPPSTPNASRFFPSGEEPIAAEQALAGLLTNPPRFFGQALGLAIEGRCLLATILEELVPPVGEDLDGDGHNRDKAATPASASSPLAHFLPSPQAAEEECDRLLEEAAMLEKNFLPASSTVPKHHPDLDPADLPFWDSARSPSKARSADSNLNREGEGDDEGGVDLQASEAAPPYRLSVSSSAPELQTPGGVNVGIAGQSGFAASAGRELICRTAKAARDRESLQPLKLSVLKRLPKEVSRTVCEVLPGQANRSQDQWHSSQPSQSLNCAPSEISEANCSSSVGRLHDHSLNSNSRGKGSYDTADNSNSVQWTSGPGPGASLAPPAKKKKKAERRPLAASAAVLIPGAPKPGGPIDIFKEWRESAGLRNKDKMSFVQLESQTWEGMEKLKAEFNRQGRVFKRVDIPFLESLDDYRLFENDLFFRDYGIKILEMARQREEAWRAKHHPPSQRELERLRLEKELFASYSVRLPLDKRGVPQPWVKDLRKLMQTCHEHSSVMKEHLRHEAEQRRRVERMLRRKEASRREAEAAAAAAAAAKEAANAAAATAAGATAPGTAAATATAAAGPSTAAVGAGAGPAPA